MNLAQFVDFINSNAGFSECISSTYSFENVEAHYSDFPDFLDPAITTALKSAGINQLYTHQYSACQAAFEGKDTVVVTPTASGKSLTYLLPIFQRKIQNPHSRALLLFPTKALSQDQQASISMFNDKAQTGFKIFTYDGDTPGTARRKIMHAGDFVVTNPDMLHSGILPHHTNWIKLFENLEFVVIDELHSYRGIFGSHVANLLRRLQRICEFYGSRPQYLCCSATIGNPRDHAKNLVGRDFQLIDVNGAPRGKKNILFYNPPIINKELGIRVSAVKEAARLGAHLISNNISCIFFCRSRLRVELLFSYLKERCPLQANRIRSYRGGYLPNERRKIEKELREGSIVAVVSTNALELGVDIGMLDVSVTVGYPGSISSLLQQFGRAGRRQNESLSILMATSDATDQYLAAHPEFFLENNPEQAILNRNNLLIVNEHIKCASYELPFEDNEKFSDYEALPDMLEYLVDNGVLNHAGNRYVWMNDVYPANEVHLRSGARENFVIVDITDKNNEKTIGELDIYATPTMLHKDAIYLHQGIQYYVEDLLWDDHQARVRRINSDYFTDAQEKVDLTILEEDRKDICNGFECCRGELMVRVKATMFKKLKLETHENLGWGDIHTPELEMHTEGSWILIPEHHDIYNSIAANKLGPVITAAAYILGQVAVLFVLCDPRDIHARSELRSSMFTLPAIFFYDSVPGGMGLSHKIMQNLSVIAGAALGRIRECACTAGCPSCSGIPDSEFPVKEPVQVFLEFLQNI